MCYMNCIYENYEGDCTNLKMMGTPMSKCCDKELFGEEEWECPNDEDDALRD